MPIPGKHSPPSEIQKTIYIVDDDEAVTDSLHALLETFGFKVQSYGSGTEFLADEQHRAAGCLLIDQHMPGASGLDVVDSLRKEGGPNPDNTDFGAARSQHQGACDPPGRTRAV